MVAVGSRAAAADTTAATEKWHVPVASPGGLPQPSRASTIHCTRCFWYLYIGLRSKILNSQSNTYINEDVGVCSLPRVLSRHKLSRRSTVPQVGTASHPCVPLTGRGCR
jgi:hypothetical protein